MIVTGAAAYILDTSTDLSDVVIYDGSHLVMASDNNVTNVLGDGMSMIHLTNSTTLTVMEEMSAHAHVYAGSEMNLGAEPEVQLISSIYIQGNMGLTGQNQTLILADPAILTVNSDVMRSLTATGIEIQANAELSIQNNNNTFKMMTESFAVEGAFSAGTLNIHNSISTFTVGVAGSVEFDPVSSDMYIGSDIDIRGVVTLGKHVSIVNPCNQFLLETGTLTWPTTSDIITIECSTVTINGQFTPGTVSFGNGTVDFTVGASGIFTFTADGPVLANTVSIAGKMYVNNLATMESGVSADKRIEAFAIHNPGGVLELNKNSLPVQLNGIADANVNCSTLKIKSLTVDKTFEAGDIDIDTGIDAISVGRYGTWNFGPCATFHVHELYTNGTITSKYPLTLEGQGLDKVHEIYIEYGGTITLDSLSQSSKNWAGTSTVGVHDFQMYGKFYAGLLQNVVAGDEGWDKLDIYKNGTFYFEPAGPFIIDYLYTNGRFESYTSLNMTSVDTDLIIHVDTKGYVKFDSLVSSDWTDESVVKAAQIQTETGSYWQSGNTKWEVTEAIIGGTLYSYPSSEAQFVYFTVTSGGSVDFSRTTLFKGHGFNVNAGGRMDIAYENTPDDTTQGSEASELLFKTVDIAGTLKAGSLHIGHLGNGVQFCENIYISGSLDVSGGGYLYDNGPG